MLRINWDEFKEFKQNRKHKADNFEILLDFMKSYYNILSPFEMFEILANDDLAIMMLEKRDITDPEGLEKYLFKINHAK